MKPHALLCEHQRSSEQQRNQKDEWEFAHWFRTMSNGAAGVVSGVREPMVASVPAKPEVIYVKIRCGKSVSQCSSPSVAASRTFSIRSG